MTAAIFGLVGVVVGALLQGVISWGMERRREGWAVRKAGRLLSADLQRCQLALEQAVSWRPPMEWSTLVAGIEAALVRWPEHADVFAGNIDQQSWVEILNCVGKLEALEYRASIARSGEIHPDDHDRLMTLAGIVFEAMLTCVLLGERGSSNLRYGRLRRALIPSIGQAEADHIAAMHPAARGPEQDLR